MSNKIFHSDPDKKKLICEHTYKLLTTFKKLNLVKKLPIREILKPISLDGIMLSSFIRAFIRCDDD